MLSVEVAARLEIHISVLRAQPAAPHPRPLARISSTRRWTSSRSVKAADRFKWFKARQGLGNDLRYKIKFNIQKRVVVFGGRYHKVGYPPLP